MKGDFLHGFEDGGYMVKDFRLFRNWEWPQAEKYRNRDLDPTAAVKEFWYIGAWKSIQRQGSLRFGRRVEFIFVRT